VSDLLEAVDHLGAVAVLAQLVVDVGPDAEVVRVAELVGVTTQGPSGPCVSKDLPIVIVGVRSCRSRTETSLEMV
jgi:hypothetical protein